MFIIAAIASEFQGSSGKQAQCNIDTGPAMTLDSGSKRRLTARPVGAPSRP
jgi:hypothetical protein